MFIFEKRLKFYYTLKGCGMKVLLMALQVSIDEAKTDFSKLLARVREGEEVLH